MGYEYDFYADYKAIEGISEFVRSERKRLFEPKKVEKFDISDLKDQLIGKTFKFGVTGSDKVVEKRIRISEVYPHCVICEYPYGHFPNVGWMKIGISVADLIEKGIISFNKGYPEVILRE